MNQTGEAAAERSAAASAPYLSLRNVGKTYHSARGDVVALEGIDLEVAKAEFVSILGPSGCGKSTLLKCVAALEGVSAGAVEIEGQAVREPPENIGMIFQRDVLLDWRTVLDNVLLPVSFRRLDTAAWRARALELLATFEIADFAERYPWELSGGMRQRVAICRGLILDPDLLLMDEPFGALDAITRDELNLELERIWERTRKTILFVTHSIPEAVFLSDRVVVMSRNPGRVVEVMEVELPRPRSLDLRETPEFGRHAGRIRTIFEGLGVMRRKDRS